MLQEQAKFSPTFQNPSANVSENNDDEHSSHDLKDSLQTMSQNNTQQHETDTINTSRSREFGTEIRSFHSMTSFHLIQKYLSPPPKTTDDIEPSPEKSNEESKKDEELKNDEDQNTDPNVSSANQTSLLENLKESTPIRKKISRNYARKHTPNSNKKIVQSAPPKIIDLERTEHLDSNNRNNTEPRRIVKRRRRTHFTARRRTNAMKQKKLAQQREQETDFNFGDLAVLDISPEGNDPWSQGMDKIVELKSPLLKETSSPESSPDSLKRNFRNEHQQGRKRVFQSRSRKMPVTFDDAESPSDDSRADQGIEIQSRVIDINKDGVVTGFLIVKLDDAGSDNQDHDLSETEEWGLNGISKRHWRRDDSSSNSHGSDDDSQGEYVSKKVKKERKAVETQKSEKPTAPANPWGFNVKVEEVRENRKDAKKSDTGRKKEERSMSIHAVNRLFELDPVGVDFL